MRILYILDKPNLYGSELHLLQIAQHFNNIHTIKVLAFSNGPLINKFIESNIDYEIINVSWLPQKVIIEKIKLCITNFNPDIINPHQPKATFWMSIIARQLKIYCISTIHSRPINNARQYKNIRYLVTLFFHMFVQFITELNSDVSIFVSNNARKESFFKRKSMVVHNWLSISYENQPLIEKKLYKPIQILSVGSITKAKGFDELIEFCHLIEKENFIVNIIGKGHESYINELLLKIDKYHLSDKINFLGYREDVGKYYNESHCFVLFSKAETFGLAYIEACYFGLPIFALELDVLKEVLPEKNYLSDNLSFLVLKFYELFKNTELYKEISNNNRRFAISNYCFKDKMKQLNEIYKGVINKS